MRVKQLLLAGVVACGLSACLDADVDMAFVADGKVETGLEIRIDRTVYDLQAAGAGFCKAADLEIRRDVAVCRAHETLTVADLVSAEVENDRTMLNGRDGMSVEDLGHGRYRVIFHLQGIGLVPESERPLPGAGRLALAGRSLTIGVSADRIESTNGTLSEDGRTTTAILPLLRLFDENPFGDEPFETVVATREPPA